MLGPENTALSIAFASNVRSCSTARSVSRRLLSFQSEATSVATPCGHQAYGSAAGSLTTVHDPSTSEETLRRVDPGQEEVAVPVPTLVDNQRSYD